MGNWISFRRPAGDKDDEERHPLLCVAIDDGPKAVQRILDAALHGAAMHLKFLSAAELRKRGASRAELSDQQLAQFKRTVYQFMATSVPGADASLRILDAELLADVFSPSCLAKVAFTIANATSLHHVFGATRSPASLSRYLRTKDVISVALARCTSMAGADAANVALLVFASWYPDGWPADVPEKYPATYADFVEGKLCYIRAFLDAGANVNTSGGEVFALVSRFSGHEDVMEELLQRPGVDANTQHFRTAMCDVLNSKAGKDSPRLAARFADVLLANQ